MSRQNILMRSFASLAVVMGSLFSFATAVMSFMDIDIYRLTAVVLIIWGAVTAYELVSVRLGKKAVRALTLAFFILLCIGAGYSLIKVIFGAGDLADVFIGYVAGRETDTPIHSTSDTFCAISAVISAAVCLLAMKRHSFVIILLLTFPIPYVCLYFALVPVYTAFAALMAGYAALASADMCSADDTDKTLTARSQASFAAAAVMTVSLLIGACYTAIVGRSEKADIARDRFVAYMSTFSFQKLTEDIQSAILPSKERSLTHDGRLGTVDEVEFDGRTMLEVTLPSDARGMYLKGFTGTSYNGTRWNTDDNYPELETDITSPEFFTGRMIKYVPGFTDLPAEYIVVRSSDNAPHPRYFPQNSAGLIETDGIRRKYWAYLPKEGQWLQKLIDSVPDIDPPEEMASDEYRIRTYAYENCLFVPASFTAADDFFAEYDGDCLYDELVYINQHLAETCTYTLESGKLPFGRDFADWFLTENKSGSCTHFASAAVLLLRSRGVPARYCEGFILRQSDIADGIQTGGYTTVTVSDSRAHAWAEIYLDGYGWVIFEATPGYGNFRLKSGSGLENEEVGIELTDVDTNAPEFPEDLFPGEGASSQSEETTAQTETETSPAAPETSAPETTAPESDTSQGTHTTAPDREDTDRKDNKLPRVLIRILEVLALTAAAIFAVYSIRRYIYRRRRQLIKDDPAAAAVQIYHMLLNIAAHEHITVDITDEKTGGMLEQKLGSGAKLITDTAVRARFSEGITSEEAYAASDCYARIAERSLGRTHLTRIVYILVCRYNYLNRSERK